MPTLTSVKDMVAALQAVPRDRPVKFIVTADLDLNLRPVGSHQVWADWSKTRPITKPLSGHVYNFVPAGLSIRNNADQIMTPVYWGKKNQIGWIDVAEWRPVTRLAVVKDTAAGQRVGVGGSRKLEAWETVQVFEEGQYCRIGLDEWVDKDSLIFP